MKYQNLGQVNTRLNEIDYLLSIVNQSLKRTDFKLLNINDESQVLKKRKRAYSQFLLDVFQDSLSIESNDGRLCTDEDPQQGIAFTGNNYSQYFAIPKELKPNFEMESVINVDEIFTNYCGNISQFDSGRNCFWTVIPKDSTKCELIKFVVNPTGTEILAKWILLNLDGDGTWNGIECSPSENCLFLTYASTISTICKLPITTLYVGNSQLSSGYVINPNLTFSEFSARETLDSNIFPFDITMFDAGQIAVLYKNVATDEIGINIRYSINLVNHTTVPYLSGLNNFISNIISAGCAKDRNLLYVKVNNLQEIHVFNVTDLVGAAIYRRRKKATIVNDISVANANYGLTFHNNEFMEFVNHKSHNYIVHRAYNDQLFEGQISNTYYCNNTIQSACQYDSNHIFYISTNGTNLLLHLKNIVDNTEQTATFQNMNVASAHGCFWLTDKLYILFKIQTTDHYQCISLNDSLIFDAPLVLKATINLSMGIVAFSSATKMSGLTYSSSESLIYSCSYSDYKVHKYDMLGTLVDSYNLPFAATPNSFLSVSIINGVTYLSIANEIKTVIYEDTKHIYVVKESIQDIFNIGSALYSTSENFLYEIATLSNSLVFQASSFITAASHLQTNNVSAFSNIVEKTFVNEVNIQSESIDYYYGVVGYKDAGITILGFDELLMNNTYRYDSTMITEMHFYNAQNNAIYAPYGIRDIVVEKDIIFVTTHFNGYDLPYFPLYVINLITDEIFAISQEGLFKYNGKIYQRNDGLGYSQINIFGITHNDILTLHAASFSINDITDFREQCPQTFVALSTNSGVSVISLNWEGAYPKIVGIKNNVFNDSQYGQYALWIAPSGNVFVGDTQYVLYKSIDYIWEFSRLDAIELQKFSTLDTQVLNIAKSSICFKDSKMEWKHKLLVGCKDTNSTMYGVAVIDSEKNMIDWIYRFEYEQGVESKAFYSPIIFEDKIFAVEIGLPLTHDYIHGFNIFERINGEYIDTTTFSKTTKYLEYIFTLPQSYSVLYSAQYFPALNILSLISNIGIQLYHYKYKEQSELISIKKDCDQPIRVSHFNEHIIENSWFNHEVISKDHASASYVDGASQTWTATPEYNYIAKDNVTQGVCSVTCNSPIYGLAVWLWKTNDGGVVTVEVFDSTLTAIESSTNIDTYSNTPYTISRKFIFQHPTHNYIVRIKHSGLGTGTSFVYIKKFTQLYNNSDNIIDVYLRLSHTDFATHYHDCLIVNNAVDTPYYNVQMIADGVSDTFSMPSDKHAHQFVSASIDGGATWTEQSLLTWGSNAPSYDDKVINENGHFTVIFSSVPAYGNIVMFKIIPKANQFQTVFKWNFAKWNGTAYMNNSYYIRLLVYITEVFGYEVTTSLENVAYTNITNTFREKQIFNHSIQLLSEVVPAPPPAGSIKIFFDQSDMTLKQIDSDGNVSPLGGGELTVLDEGVFVATTNKLDFIGAGVLAKDGTGKVNVYIPPPEFVSHYNTTDGTSNASVSDIPTTSRNISAPITEGSPFKIGDWTAGTKHPATNSGTLNYNTTEDFSVLDNSTTTFTVTVYDANGTDILAQHGITITGNTTVTSENITIIIADWVADTSKYKCKAQVSINIDAILPDGGRFSVVIEHDDKADGIFTKTQSNIFYDPNNNLMTITTPTIGETAGGVVTKFISGVEYYTTGSQFTVQVSDIDYTNDSSYPDANMDIEATNYGLPALSVSYSSFTGWTNLYNDVDDSYIKTNWAINAANFFYAGSLASARARTRDWVNGSWQNGLYATVLIETHNTASTRLNEYFYDESWRCHSDGDFDAGGAKDWDSTIDVWNDDAVFYNGGCERNTTNFQIYDPNHASQPDYSSGQDTTVCLWRQFEHDGSSSSSCRIYISGTYDSMYMKLAKAWDGTSDGGTVWVNCLADYNASQWNNGNPLASTGCRTYVGSGYIDITFGTNNISNCNNTMYLRVCFTGSQRITTLRVVFS